MQLCRSLAVLAMCCAEAAALRAPATIHRRAFVGSGFAAAAASGLAALSAPQAALAEIRAIELPKQAAARVAAYPPLEYLEPLYELRLSLNALNAVAQEESRWPSLKKRLDKFFGGGPLSEKFYYIGLSQQYTDRIKYDDLEAFISQDKADRRLAIREALDALEQCKKALEEPSPERAAVTGAAGRAKAAINRWFGLVPASDTERVGLIFRAVRAADTDRNGKLSASELATLDAADAATWKARVAYVGD